MSTITPDTPTTLDSPQPIDGSFYAVDFGNPDTITPEAYNPLEMTEARDNYVMNIFDNYIEVIGLEASQDASDNFLAEQTAQRRAALATNVATFVELFNGHSAEHITNHYHERLEAIHAYGERTGSDTSDIMALTENAYHTIVFEVRKAEFSPAQTIEGMRERIREMANKPTQRATRGFRRGALELVGFTEDPQREIEEYFAQQRRIRIGHMASRQAGINEFALRSSGIFDRKALTRSAFEKTQASLGVLRNEQAVIQAEVDLLLQTKANHPSNSRVE